jgi:hypothetical protein
MAGKWTRDLEYDLAVGLVVRYSVARRARSVSAVPLLSESRRGRCLFVRSASTPRGGPTMPIVGRTVRPTSTARSAICRLRPPMPTTLRWHRAECRRVSDRRQYVPAACRRDGVGPAARRRVGTACARGGQGSRPARRGCRELRAHAHRRPSGRRDGLAWVLLPIGVDELAVLALVTLRAQRRGGRVVCPLMIHAVSVGLAGRQRFSPS